MKVKRAIEDRAHVIGMSSAAAHLGLSSYRSPYDAYLEYIGDRPEPTEEEKERFEMGHALEDFIAHQAEKKYGIKVRRSNFAYINPKYPHLLCHPDRLVPTPIEGERVALEIKSSSAFDRRWGAPDTDEIPMDYLVQSMGYFICEVPCEAVWLIRFSNNALTRYIIRPNEELMKAIAGRLEEIALSIESGWKPDPLTYREAAALILPTEGCIEASSEIRDKLGALDELKAEMKALKDREDILKRDIVSYMDGAMYLTVGGDKVASYKTVIKTTFDSKRFGEDHPELYTQYMKQSSYQTLR